MHAAIAKRVIGGERERGRHHASAGNRCVHPVAGVARAERAADDVADRQLADHPLGRAIDQPDCERHRRALTGTAAQFPEQRAVRDGRVQVVPVPEHRGFPRGEPRLVGSAQLGPGPGVAASEGPQLHRPVPQHDRPPGRVHFRRSSRRTSTVEPALAVITFSPSTSRPFASARPESV